MAEPILTFLYNSGSSDTPYVGSGEESGDWKIIKTVTASGVPDTKVFTGGGINGTISTPTSPFGARDATLRPVVGRTPIPQTFVESTQDNIMRHVPLAGKTTNRYVFCVYVDGQMTSDLYMECWDDNTFLTVSLATLSGTTAYPDSMVNAIRTTQAAPPSGWEGVTLSGGYTTYSGAVCLRGYNSRLRLKGTDSIQNEALYFNMYVHLPYDATLFHDQPVEAYRYLYI